MAVKQKVKYYPKPAVGQKWSEGSGSDSYLGYFVITERLEESLSFAYKFYNSDGTYKHSGSLSENWFETQSWYSCIEDKNREGLLSW
jgi:hypothetical protein